MHKFFSLAIGISVLMQPALALGSADEGKSVFVKAGCVNCHANGGNDVDPKHPISGPKFAKKFSEDKDIEKKVRHGVRGTAMPAFDTKKISDSDMANLIAYIRSLNTAENHNAAK